MTRKKTLNWQNAHSLDLEGDGQGATATLKLVKTNGTQNIRVHLPPNLTVEMVESAWFIQGEKWEELFLCEKPAYWARRVIWIPGGGALAWDLCHVGDAPFDTFGYIDLEENAWRAQFPDKIVATVAA